MIALTLLLVLASGLCAARLLDVRRSLGLELAAALLSGLLQVGALSILAIALHRSPVPIVIGGAVLSVIFRFVLDRPGRSRRDPGDGDRRVLVLVLLLTLVVLLPALSREWIRVRSDAWYHAALVQEITTHGLLPQDPYFAGLRLQYMWFFHCVLIGLQAAFAPNAFVAMVLVNGVGLFALAIGIHELSLALGREPRSAWRAAWVTPLGMGVLFWLLLPLRVARALLGSTHDAGSIWSSVTLERFDIGSTRTYLSEFGSHVFFLNKFLVGTAYGLALAFLIFHLVAIARWLNERKRSQLFAASLWELALLLFHPLAGVSVVLITGLCLAVMIAWPRLRSAYPLRALLQWVLALGAAGLLASPYLLAISGARSGAQVLPLGFSPRVMLALISGALWAIICGVPWLKRLWREGTASGRHFVLWITATWIVALFVRLPGPNSADKFGFMTYLPLGILAAWWTADHWRGRRGAVLLLLLLGPANLIAYAGYFGDRDPRTIDRARDEAYAWLREQTPPDAIVVEKPERVDLPVLLPRRIYYGREAYATQFEYPAEEMSSRRALVTRLFEQGSELDLPRTRTSLCALGHRTYILLRLKEAGDRAAAMRLAERPDLFAPRWSNGSFSLLEIR